MNKRMPTEDAIADHWAPDEVYSRIKGALKQTYDSLDNLTVKDLAAVDHYHARGFPATVELGDCLPIEPDHHILDIGCGLGGPARYFAQRFGCRVTGIDITRPFVAAARKLTHLVGLADKVAVEQGDGQNLPYDDHLFDGAYSQHVTMNVVNRSRFYAEAYRVLKPGAFFALTEQGAGPMGDPHYPLPWSEAGEGAYLVPVADTVAFLKAAGFEHLRVKNTGVQYLQGYQKAVARASRGPLPPLGVHIFMGPGAIEKIRNAGRNIAEGRTDPVQIVCRKPVPDGD